MKLGEMEYFSIVCLYILYNTNIHYFIGLKK